MRCEMSAGSTLRVAACAFAVVFAGSFGGCSSGQTTTQAPRAWVGAPPAPIPGQQVAEAYKPEPGDPIKDAPVEPLRHGRIERDDPTEPFSPNYGRVPGQSSPTPRQMAQPSSGRIAAADFQ
jgi:hypothetical protein